MCSEKTSQLRKLPLRETIVAGERLLKELAERDLSGLEILAVGIDGIELGQYRVICAVGMDAAGCKHVPVLREGATDNAVVARALLEDLARRGLDSGRRRLFVFDGAKALRSAIHAVFGADQPVQLCRNYKLRKVVGQPPEDRREPAEPRKSAGRQIFQLTGGHHR
jgi:hypothetical protein